MDGPPLEVSISVGSASPRRLRVGTPPVVLGRSRAAQVRLPAPDVSGAHARVTANAGTLQVEDLGSENGTWLDEARLPAGTPRPLPPQATLRIGPYRVRIRPAEPGPPDEDTDALAARLVQDLVQSGAAPPATLQIREPDGTARTAVLALQTPVHVGRDPDGEVTLADEDVSRRHAVFRLTTQGVTVEDLGSKNGVLRMGERLRGTTPLRHGDTLQLGGTEVQLVDPAMAWLDEAGAPAERRAPDETPAATSGESAAAATPEPDASAPTPGPPVGQARASRSAPAGQLARAAVVILALGVMVAAGWALVRLLR